MLRDHVQIKENRRIGVVFGSLGPGSLRFIALFFNSKQIFSTAFDFVIRNIVDSRIGISGYTSRMILLLIIYVIPGIFKNLIQDQVDDQVDESAVWIEMFITMKSVFKRKKKNIFPNCKWRCRKLKVVELKAAISELALFKSLLWNKTH